MYPLPLDSRTIARRRRTRGAGGRQQVRRGRRNCPPLDPVRRDENGQPLRIIKRILRLPSPKERLPPVADRPSSPDHNCQPVSDQINESDTTNDVANALVDNALPLTDFAPLTYTVVRTPPPLYPIAQLIRPLSPVDPLSLDNEPFSHDPSTDSPSSTYVNL